MQDDKFNEIAEEYSTDNELTDKYAGFKENCIRSKSRYGLEKKCAFAEDDSGQKEDVEQGVELYQELIDSEKRRLERTSDSNQTSPQSQEEINDQGRNLTDFKDEAYWENYNGKQVTLEGQVPWSCDSVDMEMPYVTNNMIIARYKQKSRSYFPSWTPPRCCFMPSVSRRCIPGKVKKVIKEERKMLARMNRIEEGISTLSKQIDRLEKIKTRYLQQSGRQGQNTRERRYDYYDDESDCDSDDEFEDESGENRLQSLASKLSGLRCRFCKSDKEYLKLDSSLEDISKNISPRNEQNILKSRTRKRRVVTRDEGVFTEEDKELSQKELNKQTEITEVNSELLESISEESPGKKKDETKDETKEETKDETKDENNEENYEESKVKENNLEETEKTPVTKNEEQTMNQETKSKRSNHNKKKRAEIAANYSVECVPYLINKLNGVPQLVEKKTKNSIGRVRPEESPH